MELTKSTIIIGDILFTDSRRVDKEEVAAMHSYIKRTFKKVKNRK